MEKESWFTAEESLALGLIDEVLPEQSSEAANVDRASWNLTAYEHPPASEVEVEAEAETLPEPIETDAVEISDRQRRLDVARTGARRVGQRWDMTCSTCGWRVPKKKKQT